MKMELNIRIWILIAGVSIPLICADDFRKYEHHYFKAFTVATNETDGFRQFLRFAKTYNVPLEVLGFGRKWEGGDTKGQGGGFKVNLLREALQPNEFNDQQIIMFTDSYDVLYLCNPLKIIEKFLAFDAGIVFSAESSIWPDTSLVNEYNEIQTGPGYKYLNSGAFIGYANTVYKMLELSANLENTADDQLFYTRIYLNEELRTTLNIKLDHHAEIFQNLYAAEAHVQLLPEGNVFELNNVIYNTKPCVLHGNGPAKLELQSVGNYLAVRWKSDEGCKDCDEAVIKLENFSINKYPKVVIAVFITKPTPFFNEFMQKVLKQNYPKSKISLFVHNAVPYHQEELNDLLSQQKSKYRDIELIRDTDAVDTITARYLAIDYCIQKSCDSYFNVDSDAHLDNEETLITMVKQNRSVVGPMLIRPHQLWSNFWGALDKQGYYKRSFDYMEIVNLKRKGLWNVPYLSSCYLLNGTVIKNPELRPVYFDTSLDSDMAFCNDMRNKGVYLHVDNRQNFGHLTDLEGFNTTKINPNLYQLFNNRWDWEQAYLHPEYHENFALQQAPLQPCPDVYWFPIMSPRFCQEFIEIMETFGQWSSGSNNDTRLRGGYEAVPTRDIHMNQVGLDDHWLEFLRLYVTPIQEMVFMGYHHNPPRSLMNFVVRYMPDEQPSLRPHHDSSTYTINIALNRPKVDYEGGGCRFLRYDCQVTDMKLGWMLMHPGRLTHFHEGLLVTKGVRYIMVSFVDP